MATFNISFKLVFRYTVIALSGVTITFSLNNCQSQVPTSPPALPALEVRDSESSDSDIYSNITYADFLRLESDKSLGEIEAIFGKAEKIQGTADQDVYRWRLRNGWVVGTFNKEERLINFKQDGLINH